MAAALREVKDVPLRQGVELGGASVDLGAVVAWFRSELIRLVEAVKGNKCLVIDPSVAGPLKMVVGESLSALKDHGVVEVLELNWGDLEVRCETILYLIRPESKATLQVASQVKQSGRRYQYRVHFVPRRSFLCEQLLRNNLVWDMIQVYEYELGLVPCDTDVLSLGMESSFAQTSLRNDDSSLMYSARALLQLQDSLGPIPDIQVKGDQSKKVLDMMLRMQLEADEERASEELSSEEEEDEDYDEDDEDQAGQSGRGEETGNQLERRVNTEDAEEPSLRSELDFARGLSLKDRTKASSIDTLLLIDRGVDLVTTMVTGLTYESLLDSLIGIRNGHVMVDAELVSQEGRGKKVSMSLNSSDPIYKTVRDSNIDSVLGVLNQKARDIKDNWQDVKGKEVEALHSYVQHSLRQHVQDSQLLPRHINIVNRLRDTVFDLPFRRMWQVEREILDGSNHLPYIEDCLARQEPWTKVLRLACLQSLIGNGLTGAQLDQLRKNVVHTYGFELLFTLDNLEKIGMLKRKVGPSTWAGLVQTFRLLPASDSGDVAYVTSGYAPLSVRLVQLAIKPGWEKAKDTLKKIPGRLICKVKQPNLVLQASSQATPPGPITTSTGPVQSKKVMLVFFTGGVTFTEIAALRFLSQQPDCPFQIIIASTAILNGKTALQTLAAKMENRLRQL